MPLETQILPCAEQPPLHVTIAPGSPTVVRLSGELDLASEESLTVVADRVLSMAPRIVRLDLTDVTFCDARGLAGILGIRARLIADGRQVSVTGVRGSVRRLFQVTGLDRRLGVV